MPMQKIGKMSLKNSGGFVARIQISFLDDNGMKQLTGQTDDVTLGFTKTVDPGDLGVPDGSMVYMHVFVVWGTDNESKQAFIYELSISRIFLNKKRRNLKKGETIDRYSFERRN